MSPDCVLLQKQLDKLARDVQREDALSHLLQDAKVVPIRRGEAVRSGHNASKDWNRARDTWTEFTASWPLSITYDLPCDVSVFTSLQ